MPKHEIEAVVFDIGGVLVDWNPRYLYRKLLPDDPEKVEYLLTHVCNHDWNAQLDAGQPFREGVAELKSRYPEYAELIEAYDRRWEEMLAEAIHGSVEIFWDVKRTGKPVYALTNWSTEKFPIARARYAVLSQFDDMIVSGAVGMKKPDPDIYELLIDRFDLNPPRTVFIDDSAPNIATAKRFGFRTIHFKNPEQLRQELVGFGVLRE